MNVFQVAAKREEIDDARVLLREYEMEVGHDLRFDDLPGEMENLSSDYTPPNGMFWLAYEGQKPAACVGVLDLGNGVCEIKRLFVSRAFRGYGVAKQMASLAIRQAKAKGFNTFRVHAFAAAKPAVNLYRDMGFRSIPAYKIHGHPETVSLELKLT